LAKNKHVSWQEEPLDLSQPNVKQILKMKRKEKLTPKKIAKSLAPVAAID